MDGNLDATMLLFAPIQVEDGIQLADGVVEVGEGPYVTLLVENHRPEALRLERGMELGGVIPAEEVISQGHSEEDGGATGTMEAGYVCSLMTWIRTESNVC